MTRFYSAVLAAALFSVPAFAQDTAAPASDAAAEQATGAVTYQFDADHSQALFSYEHMGFSTSYGVANGIEGTVVLNNDDPAASTVEAKFPLSALKSISPKLDEHLRTADFFDGSDGEVTFVSTKVEQTGDSAADVIGDLTLNDVTKSVVLEITLNQRGTNPVAQKEAAGFTGSTTIKRSDFDLGMFAPAVSDELQIMLNIEAFQE